MILKFTMFWVWIRIRVRSRIRGGGEANLPLLFSHLNERHTRKRTLTD